MTRFIYKSLIYLICLLAVAGMLLAILSMIVEKHEFSQEQTESNLLVMGEEKSYDLLLMGISHARNFSRHGNHDRLEDILGLKILNIGQGNGACGANEQLFYLDYFYHKENNAIQVAYILSPPLFFNNELPQASNTFNYEPIALDFLWRYMQFPSTNKKERIISYLQSKTRPAWILHRPASLDAMRDKLDSLDHQLVVAGQLQAYNDSLSKKLFEQCSQQVEASIMLAKANGSDVVLIIPPALFGKWKGHEQVVRFAQEMEKVYGANFYDFSESILTPELYYDHHHLNTDGIVLFAEKYLKKVVRQESLIYD